jgi:hypothetical protein
MIDVIEDFQAWFKHHFVTRVTKQGSYHLMSKKRLSKIKNAAQNMACVTNKERRITLTPAISIHKRLSPPTLSNIGCSRLQRDQKQEW